MDPTMLSPTKRRTPRDGYTPSPRPFIHLKRRFNSPHSSPFTPPTPPKYRISWFHGRLARRNGHEITKAAAAKMSRKQLVEADWETQKQELLQVAAEENASIEDEETNEDAQNPYDPNAEPSIPVPTWLLFPKTPKIRKHVHSPLHQTPKVTTSQLRKNLIRSPSRRHSKALVFEDLQTSNKASPTRSNIWTPINFKLNTKVHDFECEIKTLKLEVKDLSRKLDFATHRKDELESATQIVMRNNQVLINGGMITNSFFTKSLVWSWRLIHQTSRCYIIFHVLYYCAEKLKPGI